MISDEKKRERESVIGWRWLVVGFIANVVWFGAWEMIHALGTK